jgi:hypothetical protein
MTDLQDFRHQILLGATGNKRRKRTFNQKQTTDGLPFQQYHQVDDQGRVHTFEDKEDYDKFMGRAVRQANKPAGRGDKSVEDDINQNVVRHKRGSSAPSGSAAARTIAFWNAAPKGGEPDGLTQAAAAAKAGLNAAAAAAPGDGAADDAEDAAAVAVGKAAKDISPIAGLDQVLPEDYYDGDEPVTGYEPSEWATGYQAAVANNAQSAMEREAILAATKVKAYYASEGLTGSRPTGTVQTIVEGMRKNLSKVNQLRLGSNLSEETYNRIFNPAGQMLQDSIYSSDKAARFDYSRMKDDAFLERQGVQDLARDIQDRTGLHIPTRPLHTIVATRAKMLGEYATTVSQMFDYPEEAKLIAENYVRNTKVLIPPELQQAILTFADMAKESSDVTAAQKAQNVILLRGVTNAIDGVREAATNFTLPELLGLLQSFDRAAAEASDSAGVDELIFNDSRAAHTQKGAFGQMYLLGSRAVINSMVEAQLGTATSMEAFDDLWTSKKTLKSGITDKLLHGFQHFSRNFASYAGTAFALALKSAEPLVSISRLLRTNESYKGMMEGLSRIADPTKKDGTSLRNIWDLEYWSQLYDGAAQASWESWNWISNLVVSKTDFNHELENAKFISRTGDVILSFMGKNRTWYAQAVKEVTDAAERRRASEYGIVEDAVHVLARTGVAAVTAAITPGLFGDVLGPASAAAAATFVKSTTRVVASQLTKLTKESASLASRGLGVLYGDDMTRVVGESVLVPLAKYATQFGGRVDVDPATGFEFVKFRGHAANLLAYLDTSTGGAILPSAVDVKTGLIARLRPSDSGSLKSSVENACNNPHTAFLVAPALENLNILTAEASIGVRDILPTDAFGPAEGRLSVESLATYPPDLIFALFKDIPIPRDKDVKDLNKLAGLFINYRKQIREAEWQYEQMSVQYESLQDQGALVHGYGSKLAALHSTISNLRKGAFDLLTPLNRLATRIIGDNGAQQGSSRFALDSNQNYLYAPDRKLRKKGAREGIKVVALPEDDPQLHDRRTMLTAMVDYPQTPEHQQHVNAMSEYIRNTANLRRDIEPFMSYNAMIPLAVHPEDWSRGFPELKADLIKTLDEDTRRLALARRGGKQATTEYFSTRIMDLKRRIYDLPHFKAADTQKEHEEKILDFYKVMMPSLVYGDSRLKDTKERITTHLAGNKHGPIDVLVAMAKDGYLDMNIRKPGLPVVAPDRYGDPSKSRTKHWDFEEVPRGYYDDYL